MEIIELSGRRKTVSNHGESESSAKARHTNLNALERPVLQKLSAKGDMMYTKCFVLFKLWSLVIMLSTHYGNTNGEIVSTHPSRIYSTIYSIIASKRPTKQLSDGNRIDFQIRNHQGPGTYIFGFDTGHGKNRQYKIEERSRDGSVKGRYGFYDAKGKLRVVSYTAGPNGGYQERHHETVRRKHGT